MNIIEIGNRIKSARGMKGITLDEIALRIGVAKSTIQRYETGKIENPKLPVLHAIANALNVNPAWLICKTDDMEAIIEKTPQIIIHYKSLNDIGKREATKRVEELTHINKYVESEPEYLIPRAAHERTDVDISEEMRRYDDDIMDDENF